jgi:CRP-like cAMP-binding protein
MMKALDILKKFYLFRDVASDDLATVEALVIRERYVPAQLVFREGDEAHAMYLVEVGTVAIVKSGATELALVGSGGEFGELAFFDGGKRPASARAREATHVLKIPFAGLAQLLERRPSLAMVFYFNASVVLARRLRQTFADLSFARELNKRHF